MGDAFIAATGCVKGEDGADDVGANAAKLAALAVEMQTVCRGFEAPDGSPLVMRVGLHVGPAIGGIVGTSLLRYHVFGSLCSDVTALEAACPPGAVHVSREFTRALFGSSSLPIAGRSAHQRPNTKPEADPPSPAEPASAAAAASAAAVETARVLFDVRPAGQLELSDGQPHQTYLLRHRWHGFTPTERAIERAASLLALAAEPGAAPPAQVDPFFSSAWERRKTCPEAFSESTLLKIAAG